MRLCINIIVKDILANKLLYAIPEHLEVKIEVIQDSRGHTR